MQNGISVASSSSSYQQLMLLRIVRMRNASYQSNLKKAQQVI